MRVAEQGSRDKWLTENREVINVTNRTDFEE